MKAITSSREPWDGFRGSRSFSLRLVRSRRLLRRCGTKRETPPELQSFSAEYGVLAVRQHRNALHHSDLHGHEIGGFIGYRRRPSAGHFFVLTSDSRSRFPPSPDGASSQRGASLKMQLWRQNEINPFRSSFVNSGRQLGDGPNYESAGYASAKRDGRCL